MAARTILIIEDDESLARALSDKLGQEGYQTDAAEDGTTGLRLALGKHPDLILLDMIMPGMGGSSVLSHLRDDEWGASVPVIVMTNLPSEVKEKFARDHNVSAYYMKVDLSMKDLLETIRSILPE